MRIKYLLLLGLLFLFSDCQKDKFVEEPIVDPWSTESISIEDDAPLDLFFNRTFGSNSLNLGKLNLPFPKSWIDKSSISKIKNTETGFTNYSFSIKKKRRQKFLYNIIVTKYGEQDFSQPYILKYIFDDAFNHKYNQGEADWQEFNGAIEQYSVYAFKENYPLEKNLLEEPCNRYTPDSGGGDPGDTPPSDGGGGDPSPPSTGGGGGGSSLSCISGTESGIWINGYWCKYTSCYIDGVYTLIFSNCTQGAIVSIEGDCPDDPNGPVSPNDGEIDDEVAYIMSELGIEDVDFEIWLGDHPSERSSIRSILDSNLSEEQKVEQIYASVGASLLIGRKVQEFSTVYAALKKMSQLTGNEHSGKGSLKLFGLALKNVINLDLHEALDAIGFLPIIGEPADFLNGVLYLVEGDKTNAVISFASTIPGSDALLKGAKYGAVILKSSNEFHYLRLVIKDNLVHFADDAGEIVLKEFGARSKLRKVLKITNSNFEAHHLIPWQFWDHPVIQKAAQNKDLPFHMNHKGNGISLEKYKKDLDRGQHANHPKYDAQVRELLNDIDINAPNLSDLVIELQNDLRFIIESNPGIKINALFP